MNAVIVISLLHIAFYHTTWSFECSVIAKTDNLKVYDYFWRDYYGVIPHDALPGGKDAVGNPTYIGQVYIQDKELLPGTIYAGCRNMRVTAYGVEVIGDTNIKILCVGNPSNYAWISTTPEEAVLLTDYHLVVGGSEVKQVLNIGRVNYETEVRVGKVFSFPFVHQGLFLPNHEKTETKFSTYEILVYLNYKQVSEYKFFTSNRTTIKKVIEE